MSGWRNQHTSLILVLLLYAVALGILVAKNDVVSGSGDPILYMQQSQNLLHYDSAFHPPLYSAGIAAVNLVVRNVFAAGKLVSYLSAIGVVWLTWLLAAMCFKNYRVALLAASLVAMSPMMIKVSYVVASDMLGTALFLASVYALALAAEGARTPIAVAGLVAGLAYLTRYVFVSAFPAALVFLLFVVPGTTREKLSRTLWFVIPFVIVVAPWSITCIARYGDLHNWNHLNIVFGMFSSEDSPVWFSDYQKQYPTFLALLLAQPAAVLRHVAKNAFHFPTEIVLRHGLLAGVFAIVGVLAVLRNPTIARMSLIVNTFFLLALLLLTWLQQRFFVPLMPLVLVFACHFLVNGVGKSLADYWPSSASLFGLLGRVPLRGPVIVLTVLTAAAFCVVRVPRDLKNSNIDDNKKAGEFVSRNTPEDSPVISSSMNAVWYAKRPYLPMSLIRGVEPEQLAQAVRSTSARVVLYTGRHSARKLPELRFLLDPNDDRVPSSFRLLYHDTGEWPVVVYWVEN